MLEALKERNFAASIDFSAFKRKHRAKHLPSKEDEEKWTTIYRHVDGDGRICLVSSLVLKQDAVF